MLPYLSHFHTRLHVEPVGIVENELMNAPMLMNGQNTYPCRKARVQARCNFNDQLITFLRQTTNKHLGTCAPWYYGAFPKPCSLLTLDGEMEHLPRRHRIRFLSSSETSRGYATSHPCSFLRDSWVPPLPELWLWQNDAVRVRARPPHPRSRGQTKRRVVISLHLSVSVRAVSILEIRNCEPRLLSGNVRIL